MRHPIRLTVLALAIALLSSIDLAEAENAADVLNDFGLLGAWSRDCAAGPTEPKDRVIYKSWSFGNPRVAEVYHQPAHTPGGREGLSNVDEREIKAAVEIDEEKIALVLAPIKRATKENGVWVNLPLGPITELTIKKIGSKIQLVDWHTIDGRGVWIKDGFQYAFGGMKTDSQTPLREKCE